MAAAADDRAERRRDDGARPPYYGEQGEPVPIANASRVPAPLHLCTPVGRP